MADGPAINAGGIGGGTTSEGSGQQLTTENPTYDFDRANVLDRRDIDGEPVLYRDEHGFLTDEDLLGTDNMGTLLPSQEISGTDHMPLPVDYMMVGTEFPADAGIRPVNMKAFLKGLLDG